MQTTDFTREKTIDVHGIEESLNLSIELIGGRGKGHFKY